MSDYFAPTLLDRLSTLWRDLMPARTEVIADGIRPDLPIADLEKLRAQMDACLDGLGGDVSARSRAAQLGQAYLSLNPQGKERFLRLLAEAYDTDHESVRIAAQALLAADDDLARSRAERNLHKALIAPRVHLLTQFNALPNGVKFLVDMRADLMALAGDDLALQGLAQDLRTLLASWFDVGFLELRRITWDSPASVLEKIIAYEAVHAIRGWDDLKNRLDSDRRLYGFFHPKMPGEPLIFVQVALVEGIAGNIQSLLDEHAPVGDPAQADTAIFYSISNAQQGLSGISFGNFLIKKVVETLSAEFPRLKTFATLSPIPGFRKWLDERLAEGEAGVLLPAEHKALTALAKARGGTAVAKGGLKDMLAQPGWLTDPELAEALRPVLMRLCARYLATERRAVRDGGPATARDSVAHFHLTNGARIERLNWLGDTSEKGVKQAAGLMVNYLYKLNEIERNHETYSAQGKAVLSSGVKALLKD
ncbi:malonyl-CoA decarboxylase [Novispirillum sp. DQ9]|uniref:malonyl-CoA decarboxylase n=1 Tax=Novispirillum sp. DQ9 TaxID=3398612 RepID=UPI003C7EA41F